MNCVNCANCANSAMSFAVNERFVAAGDVVVFVAFVVVAAVAGESVDHCLSAVVLVVVDREQLVPGFAGSTQLSRDVQYANGCAYEDDLCGRNLK